MVTVAAVVLRLHPDEAIDSYKVLRWFILYIHKLKGQEVTLRLRAAYSFF